jgi:hypothetical protein
VPFGACEIKAQAFKVWIDSSSLSARDCTSAWVGGLDTCSLNSQLSTLNQSGELAAHFARGQRGVIDRQSGIEDRGGHKQGLVCFPSPCFYARAAVGATKQRHHRKAFRRTGCICDCGWIKVQRVLGFWLLCCTNWRVEVKYPLIWVLLFLTFA